MIIEKLPWKYNTTDARTSRIFPELFENNILIVYSVSVYIQLYSDYRQCKINFKKYFLSEVTDALALDEKEYSLRWNFEGKGVLLFDQKEYSFWSIF